MRGRARKPTEAEVFTLIRIERKLAPSRLLCPQFRCRQFADLCAVLPTAVARSASLRVPVTNSTGLLHVVVPVVHYQSSLLGLWTPLVCSPVPCFSFSDARAHRHLQGANRVLAAGPRPHSRSRPTTSISPTMTPRAVTARPQLR